MEKEEFINKTLKHLGFTHVAPDQATYEFISERLDIVFKQFQAALVREKGAFALANAEGYNQGISIAKQNIENNYIRIDKLKHMTLSEISSLISED